MEKTIKINLGGTLFQVNEDAYQVLRSYLQSLDQTFGNLPEGNETIADIEMRLAEIFSYRHSPGRHLTKEDVESAISVIGKPDDFEIPEDEAVRDLPVRKRLFRNPDDRIIGGVCGGIGANLNIDPVWIRLLFVFFTIFFGAGVVVYVALWIAIPPARSEADKKEMYGSTYYREKRYRQSAEISRTGNAVNEIFRAAARVIFIFLRIILVIIGAGLLLSAFIGLISFIMVFVFGYPGAFSTSIDGFEISYLPDFLKYLFAPATAEWITILSSVIIILPMVMIIYWGVRMIFWLRVRDGIFNLSALIIWVISVAALSVILLNEGTNYSQHSNSTINESLGPDHDTLFIIPGRSTSQLEYEHSIYIPDENYEIMINENPRAVHIRSSIKILQSDNSDISLEVKRRSSGRNRQTAGERTRSIIHDFGTNGNTIKIDEYLSYPGEMKWGFDEVRSMIYVPEGTILGISVDNRNFENYRIHNQQNEDNIPGSKNNMKFWKMTDDGPKFAD